MITIEALQRIIPEPHEAREFTSREEAIAWLQSIDQPDSIIIITPPPH